MCRGGWEECGFECKALEDWNGQQSKMSHPCTCLLKFSARPACCLGKDHIAQSQDISSSSEVLPVKEAGTQSASESLNRWHRHTLCISLGFFFGWLVGWFLVWLVFVWGFFYV